MSAGLNTGRIRHTVVSRPVQTIRERAGWGMIALTPANLTIFLISYLLLDQRSDQMLLFFSYVLGITLSITIAGIYIVIVEKTNSQGSMPKVNESKRPGVICSVCGAIVPAGGATCAICGSKLLRTCGFCGLLIGDASRICPRCKNPL
jgi:RNA polymerase subunit RPABC4/transcription elongation factor Spt4